MDDYFHSEQGNASVTTSQSWFSRLRQSLVSSIIGLLLFIIAFPLMFWNESRAIQVTKGLDEGLHAAITIQADTVNPAHEGKLVYVHGPLQSAMVLDDATFGVQSKALKLHRMVEMYQWHESQDTREAKRVGGSLETTTNYSYQQQWLPELENSNQFHVVQGHVNPSEMLFENQEVVAPEPTLGSFILSDVLFNQYNPYEVLPLTDTLKPLLQEQFGETGVFLVDNRIYLGQSPTHPQIGDLRIQFKVVPQGPVTIVAMQEGHTFAPYPTQSKTTIALIAPGKKTLDEMFKSAKDQNWWMTWGLRLLGFILVFGGLSVLTHPLVIVADLVPIIGDVVGMIKQTSLFFVALSLSTLTIGLSWLIVRPLIGLAVLSITLLGLVGLVFVANWVRQRLRYFKAKQSRSASPSA